MDPDQTTPVAPVSDQPVSEPITPPVVPPPSEPASVPENSEPSPEPVIIIPETPPISPNPPDLPNSPDVPQPEDNPQPPAEPLPPEPQPSPPPITPVNVPIPNFRFPFNGDFPVTFPFNAQPTTDEMKAKFAQWGITGHHGTDFGLPEGTEVLAVDSGKVIQSGDNSDYGNTVTIQHPWGQSLYAHLKEVKVPADQDVDTGDLIGLSGQTGGGSFGPHLHFGIKPNNPDSSNGFLGFVDPSPYLPAVARAEEGLPQISQISQISPIPPIPSPVEEPKPEEPKPPEPPVETPAPVIPEPAINIEPVSPTSPPVVDVQAQIDEALKLEQNQRMILANQARSERKTDHLTKIMQFAQEKREITNQQVRDLLHVSQSTATNYLTELVNKGQLRIDKKASATTYNY